MTENTEQKKQSLLVRIIMVVVNIAIIGGLLYALGFFGHFFYEAPQKGWELWQELHLI